MGVLTAPTRRSGLAAVMLGLLIGTAAPGAPAASAAPNSLGLRASYDVQAKLDYGRGRLSVTSTATVANPTDASVGRLLFNLLPARIGRMSLGAVSVAGEPAATRLSGQSIVVILPTPLAAGARTTVTIAYSARFATDAKDKNWLFAKINGIVTAYRWIPWLSRATAFARPNFGEPFVTGTSRRVKVSIRSDRKLTFATTGRRAAVNGLSQRFVAQNVRDFNFSASPSYRVRRETWGGVAISIYYNRLPPSELATWTRRALKRFSARLGPYPYSELAVAESHLGLGMESPQLIWIPQSSYGRGNLAYLVIHEMAHQWFYGVVGSDGAAEPFADEGLAEFLTRDMLASVRSSQCPGTLDRTVYEYSAGCYYETVYVEGARYLDRYRRRVGDTAFWRGMAAYYEQNRFGIGNIRAFLDSLDAASGSDPTRHITRFPRTYSAE